MGATWLGWYVPHPEDFVAPKDAIEIAVACLTHLAGPISAPSATLNDKGRTLSLYLHESVAGVARDRLFGDEEPTPVWLSVEQYPEPEPWEDDCSQRFCGACGALVPTRAICEACGIEEDPQQWSMGPNAVLFRYSFGFAVCLQGGPNLVTLPHADLDRRLRSFLDGSLELLEERLRCRLTLHPTVVA